jgi:hypothetical protein
VYEFFGEACLSTGVGAGTGVDLDLLLEVDGGAVDLGSVDEDGAEGTAVFLRTARTVARAYEGPDVGFNASKTQKIGNSK